MIKYIIAMLAVCVMAGCGTIGNGKLDIPEVDIGMVAADGTVYRLAYDEYNGLIIEGEYTDPRTGIVFKSKDGVISATHPETGLTVIVRPQVGE